MYFLGSSYVNIGFQLNLIHLRQLQLLFPLIGIKNLVQRGTAIPSTLLSILKLFYKAGAEKLLIPKPETFSFS